MHAPSSEFMWPNRNTLDIPDLAEHFLEVLFREGKLRDEIGSNLLLRARERSFHDLAYLLYHIGVSLINTGLAYSIQLRGSDGQLRDPLSLKSNAIDSTKRAKLLEIYNKLINLEPPTAALAAKPYHYIFIAKVALDHLPPDMILNIFQLLGGSSEDTFRVEPITFPNGSICSAAKAAYDVVRTYIHSNTEKELFAAFVNEHRDRFASSAIYPYLYFGLFTKDPKVAAICHLDLPKELNNMPVASNLTLERWRFFFRRNIIEQDLFNIDEEKKIIIGYFSGYTSLNKPSYFTRTNTDRATALIEQIEKAQTLTQIDNSLTVAEDYLNGMCKSSGGLLSWLGRSTEKRELTPEEKQQSGFYRAVSNARNFLNQITGKEQPAHLASEPKVLKM